MIGVILCLSMYILSAVALEFKTPMSTDALHQTEYEIRIIGGTDATIEEHPYQVSYIVNKKIFCGGFIISENYILTAAHCIKDADPSTVLLRAGSAWRTNGTIIPLAEVITHPEYGPKFDKDIGIMRTVAPMKFNDVINRVKLAKRGSKLKDNSKVIVSGWGKTSEGSNGLPERLQRVSIPVVTWLQCSSGYYFLLTNNMWCGGVFQLGGQGTCNGDSGGAAVQNGRAVGIVSFGRGCARPKSPSVFADIGSPPIRDFITKFIGL